MTSDIAYAFGTPPTDAEAIKVRHGCALGSIVGKDENVEVPSVGGRPPRSLQRQTLAEVIEPRYTELLNTVNDEILQLQEQLRQQGVKHHLAAGIVLTGGAAQIEGLAACAQRVFHTGAHRAAAEYYRIDGLCAGALLLNGGRSSALWKRVSPER